LLKNILRHNLFKLLNYCKTIDIGEGIPHNLKRILGKKKIFLLHLNKLYLNDGFENYIVAKIFNAPSNDKKIWKKKKYTQSNMLY